MAKIKLIANTESYSIYNGSMLDMLEVIEPNIIDSIITDPPYELNFMNKGWDRSGIAFQKETWEKCYEVLKPGGYLLAFCGSRTHHRIACAIEDAGFEIRDTIMWLYGSGFPKSMNLSKALEARQKLGNTDLAKQWEGWGTALKPSFEPIIVARKPFKGSLVDNIINYGVGGLNIDECRVPVEDTHNPASNPKYRKNAGYKLPKKRQTSNGAVAFTSSKNETNDLGRFPANTILTYDETDYEEVCGGFPNTKSQVRVSEDKDIKQNTWSLGRTGITPRGHNDSGSASRFFYCAKASKKDRDEGLFDYKEEITTDGYIRSNEETARKFGANSALRKNIHPTVKPCELMQYLVRLVTPKGGIILDPFMGSGSTGKACMFENRERNANYKFIGIDLEKEYCNIARDRIDYALNKYKYDYQQELKKAKEKGQMSLF